MIVDMRVSASNSVLLILDPTGDGLPESMGGELVAATSACIAVGTLAEFDGETRLRLLTGADRAQSIGLAGLSSAFAGSIDTPSRQVAIMTVLGELLVAFAVDADAVMVEVLVNDPSEPDDIVVTVQPAALTQVQPSS